jgi:alkyl sulfatase BDS1-like metallo-beta-lactamase superfamily hydrolase
MMGKRSHLYTQFALAGLLCLGAAPAAIGCGFHSPLGVQLESMYPGSFPVAVALRRAADSGDKSAPDTVNPSLWRQAQVMQHYTGLFKVAENIYQVRGLDITNITFIEAPEGLIIMDPLLSAETAKAGLDLYRKHRGNKPIVAVIHTHSHIDHYGGAMGVISHEDIKSGKVKIYAPEGYTKAALDEGVIGGNRQTRLSGYQHRVTTAG